LTFIAGYGLLRVERARHEGAAKSATVRILMQSGHEGRGEKYAPGLCGLFCSGHRAASRVHDMFCRLRCEFNGFYIPVVLRNLSANPVDEEPGGCPNESA
jgi:hypothetical protein